MQFFVIGFSCIMRCNLQKKSKSSEMQQIYHFLINNGNFLLYSLHLNENQLHSAQTNENAKDSIFFPLSGCKPQSNIKDMKAMLRLYFLMSY